MAACTASLLHCTSVKVLTSIGSRAPSQNAETNKRAQSIDRWSRGFLSAGQETLKLRKGRNMDIVAASRRVCTCARGHDESKAERREVLLSMAMVGATLAAQPFLSVDSASAEEATAVADASFASLQDPLNAYQFRYPTVIPGTATQVAWVETRHPERYSSAAPLAPDARLRIVSERLDFRNNLVASVLVGPPNAAFLRTQDPATWRAVDVAKSVLADKSTARLTPEQRLAEVSIEAASTSTVDGEQYWFFEYLQQKSPTMTDYSQDVYRHSLAVSASREGYIYTLNVSTLNAQWEEREGAIRDTINSFRFTPLTKDYVPPWKDPWRFW